MPTECLASWKSPLLAGAAIGTVFLMIGIDMTAAEYAKYEENLAAARDRSGETVMAPIDGPIFISVAMLCYIIGIISSCRKYYKYSTTAVFCPCCRKGEVTDNTEGQQTRTTSVDTLTEPSSRDVEADIHVLTEAKKSALKKGKEMNNQHRVQNGINKPKPLPHSISKQRVTFESTAVLIERTPATPTAPVQPPLRLSPSPSSPTPLMRPVQEYMEYERETSSGSHSDNSCRPFLRRSTSQPCGLRANLSASPRPLPVPLLDTDSSVILSDGPECWLIADSERAANSDGKHTDTTTSGSSGSRAVSRRDKDKYNYAEGLHSQGIGAVIYQARSSSSTRLSDMEPEMGNLDIHTKGIGAISPPTLHRIKSKIHERQYASSVDVSRNYMYPGQYSFLSPKRVNFLVLPRQGYDGVMTRKSPSGKRRRPASFAGDIDKRTSQGASMPVRKSFSFNASPLNVASPDHLVGILPASSPCDTPVLLLPRNSIPDRPTSPVPPKSPRMRRSSSSSHSSGSSRNYSSTSPHLLLPRSASSNTLQTSLTGRVRRDRSTSSSSLGRVDEQEVMSEESVEVRPWLTPPRHSYLHPTGVDGKSQTSRSSADGSPSTPRSIQRPRPGRRR